MKNRHYIIQALCVLAMASAASVAAAADAASATTLRKLNNATAGKLVVTRQSDGTVSQLRASANPIPVASNISPEVRARSFLADSRALFVKSTTLLDLNLQRTTSEAASDARHVRFSQSFNGIPVRAAEAIVHLNAVGVTSVQSTLLPDLASVNLTPRISSSYALNSAATTMSTQFPGAALNYTMPNLEIVNVEMLYGRPLGESRLAWFTEVRGRGVREFLWVDALDGKVLTHFSQIAHAFIDSGIVADYGTKCSDDPTATPVLYDFSVSPPLNSEAETAFNNAAAAYNYFLDTFGRSLSGHTGTTSLTALMNLCDTEFLLQPLVMEKAEWDGVQMKFATGVSVADDIVGHEYTHALLDNETGINSASKPTYMIGQTGALAEGFADIFGEVVDLVKNTSNDAGDTRWDIGEEISGGPFRNLMTPSTFNLPGKTSDTSAYCGTDDDIEIHTNGAVLAHAFALVTDGGTYNGITVTEIGITKSAEIFYRAMTDYMTSVTSFVQVYDGLISVADGLVTAGTITTSDRTQLVKALNAVELNKSPCTSHLDYCPTGQGAQAVFGDDFETITSGKWVNTVNAGVNHWNTGAGTPDIYFKANTTYQIAPYNGTYSLWADGNRGDMAAKLGDSVVEMASGITIPANARMQFEGKFTFEQMSVETGEGPDGGVIEYSVNGGAWQNAESLIDGGQAYTGIIQTGQDNPLAGAPAFVGTNGGYHSTQLNLQSLAGQSVRFRFRVGTDNFGTYMGWLIDDVSIYTCSPAGLVVTPTTGLTTSEAGGSAGLATFTVSLADAPSSSVYLAITSSNTAEGTVDKAELVFNPSDYDQPQTVTVTGVDDSSADGSQNYTVTVSVATTNDQGYLNLADVLVSAVNTDNESGTTSKKGGGGGDIGSYALGLLVLMLLFARREYFYQRCIQIPR